MENDLKNQILRIIQEAESAREMALHPDNWDTLGYAFTAGYSTSALKNIRELVEVA
jgi:hypothetical protein